LEQNSRGQGLAGALVDPSFPGGLGEDLVDEAGVDQYQRGLQLVHAQHRGLLALAVGARPVGVLAVVDRGVAGISLLDDLQPFVDLAALRLAGEVLADERPCAPARPGCSIATIFGCFELRSRTRRRICSASAVQAASLARI